MSEIDFKDCQRMISHITAKLVDFVKQFNIDPNCINEELRELTMLSDLITSSYIEED